MFLLISSPFLFLSLLRTRLTCLLPFPSPPPSLPPSFPLYLLQRGRQSTARGESILCQRGEGPPGLFYRLVRKSSTAVGPPPSLPPSVLPPSLPVVIFRGILHFIHLASRITPLPRTTHPFLPSLPFLFRGHAIPAPGRLTQDALGCAPGACQGPVNWEAPVSSLLQGPSSSPYFCGFLSLRFSPLFALLPPAPTILGADPPPFLSRIPVASHSFPSLRSLSSLTRLLPTCHGPPDAPLPQHGPVGPDQRSRAQVGE